MEVLSPPPHRHHLPQSSPNSMNWSSLASKLKPVTLLSPARFGSLCTISVQVSGVRELTEAPVERRKSSSRSSSRARVKVGDGQLKEKWLSSLSCPSPAKMGDFDEGVSASGEGCDWMIGVDPDVSGALALLKTDESGCSAQVELQKVGIWSLISISWDGGLIGHNLLVFSDRGMVFDSPHVQVLVGKNRRRRLDSKSIVQLLRSLNAPSGTTAYIEQSTPFPTDGKQNPLNQGWWGGGFGYGLWIGILVASGFSVVPVSSALWKNEFELFGSRSNKDSGRDLASELFPTLSPMLKRKKDHGRAEALLIAAYGRRCKTKADEAGVQPESMS